MQESLAQFEDDPSIIYALDSEFRIIWCNRAWDKFAAENGGIGLGRENQIGCDLIQVIAPPLRPFYEKMYKSVLSSGKEADFVYECSSDELLRRLHMSVKRKDLPNQGPILVVVNSIVVEKPHGRAGARIDLKELRAENGLITMCAHCRRTSWPKHPEAWLWVPDFVRKIPTGVSHGLCPVCFKIFYGNSVLSDADLSNPAKPPRRNAAPNDET